MVLSSFRIADFMAVKINGGIKFNKVNFQNFYFYRKKAIQAIFNTPLVHTYVHFVLGAGLIEIGIKTKKMEGQLKLL